MKNSFSPSKIMRKSRFSPLSSSNPLLEEREEPVHSSEKDSRAVIASPTFTATPKSLLFTPEPGQVGSFLGENRGKPSMNISGWKKVNTQLADGGFPQISFRPLPNGDFSPDSDSTCEILSLLLSTISQSRKSDLEIDVKPTQKRFKSIQSELESLRDELKRGKLKWEEEKRLRQDDRFEMDRTVREVERDRAMLRGKVEAAQMQLRQRDQLIAELKSQSESPPPDLPQSTDRDRLIFEKYFSRQPKSITDSKVLGLINAYEEMRKRSFADSRNSFTNFPLKNAHKTMGNSGKTDILAKIMALLELKSENLVVSTVEKMLKVIRALPSLELFIKSISSEVLDLSASGNTALDAVLPTIRLWKQRASLWEELNTMKKDLCLTLKIDGNGEITEIVREYLG